MRPILHETIMECSTALFTKERVNSMSAIEFNFFKKWANHGLYFVLFLSFSHYNFNKQIEKSIYGVLGIQTCGCRW